MPTDGKTQTDGFLEQLSTEQLFELVRADFESSEDGDNDFILCILEVIEEREKKAPTGLLSDVDQAWEDFQKYFNTPDGVGRSLYPVRVPDEKAVEKRSKRRRRRLLKPLLPLSAVVAVTIFSMVAVQAFGVDVFGALARWTQETFYFLSGTPSDPGSPESETFQQTIQEIFDRYDVSVPAPAWYPEGTEWARDAEVNEQPEISTIICSFTYNGKFFSMDVQQYSGQERILRQTFEKDSTNLEEYYSNGRLFYIMSNISDNRAIYSNDQTVLLINGELSLDVLKQIIDSIGA